MTPDVEDLLRELYRGLSQEELEPDDPRYVSLHDFDGAFGPDVVTDLARAVSWTTEGSVFFLSGTRGSGKSTQLLRLRNELTARGFAAAVVSAEDYLNLRQPLEIVEFLYAMVGGVSDAVAAEGWISTEQALEHGWGGLARWFKGLRDRVEVIPEASLGGGVDVFGVVEAKVNVKAQLRQDASFVAGLNRYLGGRVSELAAAANEVIDDLVAQLREAWARRGGAEWKGLVVLFDDLDHVRGVDFDHVRLALQTLMDTHSSTIKLRSSRVVFVVPPWVHVDYEPVRRLSNVKVRAQDGSLCEEGLRALRAVVEKRTPAPGLGHFFADDASLDALLADSGGHLRDVLRLVREASISAEALPFSDELLVRARQTVRENLVPLADDEKACLRLVARTHEVPLTTQGEWRSLAGLFDRHLVLGYKNGDIWYGVHPLIAGDLGE